MSKPRRSWGSLNQRDKNVWSIRYSIPDPITNKRIQKSETVYGTKSKAELRLAELRLKYCGQEEIRGTSLNLTVDMCWNEYYLPYVTKHLAKSTISGYMSAYKCSVYPFFGNRDMETIEVREVKAWLQDMTYGAAKKALAVMRAMFNFAEDEELIDRNVMDRRFRLPKNRATTRTVNNNIHNAETLNQIYKDCRGESWEAGFILSAFGGFRREEAFGVKAEEITFKKDHALVPIERVVQRIDGEVYVSEDTKTEESRRTGVIPAPYSIRLKELANNALKSGDVYLMDNGFGMPMCPDQQAQAYKRWHLDKPYPFIPWKNLRNSYATMLAENNVPIEVVAKLLGHTTPTITYKHYERPSTDFFAETLLKSMFKN